MLTPFIHASKNGYENAFNIDADDIMIFADPKKVAEALKEASSYAKDNEVDCLNLDMLVSKTFGVHWSFGVVFMNHPKTCLDKIAQNFNWWSDFKRQKEYKVSYVKRYNFNVDWLFTFLRDTKQLSLKTFAIKNALVIHMPDIVITPTWTFAFQWREDSLYFPVYDLLYKNHKLANIPISPKVLLLDVGLGSDSYVDFANTFYWWGFDFENDMLDVALERGDIDQLKHDEHFIFSNPRSRY